MRREMAGRGAARVVEAIADLPAVPAVYAMRAGAGRPWVVYVGIGSNLRQRITQHLIRRDSSVTTGVSAVSLNPDLVIDVLWWEADEFSDPTALEAAERIAFDTLEPVLRSRGASREAARALADDDSFRTKMHRLFTAVPSGRLALPSFDSMVERVRHLEHRVTELESRLGDARSRL